MSVTDASAKADSRLPEEDQLDALITSLKEQLADLEPQVARRRALLDQLTGKSTPSPAQASRMRTRAPSKPASNGDRGAPRRDQAMALIREHPGIAIPDLARLMGLKTSNYLYRIKDQLKDRPVEAGRAIWQDGRFFPLDEEGQPIPARERVEELAAAAS